nr:5547_t:CDS:2 [Entrophospora candida]
MSVLKTLLENKNNSNNNNLNSDSDLPGPQLIFYLTLLNELAQIPNFDINNAELAKIFTNSWRNASTEFTDEFIILAAKLGLD